MSKTINLNNNQKRQEIQIKNTASEYNLTVNSLWLPQENKKVFDIRLLNYHFSEVNTFSSSYVSIEILPNAKLGTLTTLDQRVFYCLSDLWFEQNKPQKCFFSVRELSRMLNVEWGRQTSKSIRDSLTRLRTVSIHWNGAFYNFSEKTYIDIDNPFTVLNHLALCNKRSKKVNSQVAEFSFDEHVVNNLLAYGPCPVNRFIVQSFNSPVAQLLYILLNRKLYGTKEYSRTTIGLLEELGIFSSRYTWLSRRKELFQKCREEILHKPTSYGEIIDYYEIEESKKDKDALLVVKRTGPQKMSLVIDFGANKDYQLKIGDKQPKLALREAKIDNPMLNPRKEKDALESENKRLKSNVNKIDKNNSVIPQYELSSQGITPRDTKSFLDQFCKLFPKARKGKVPQSVIKEAEKFVTTYGETKSQRFLQYCFDLANQSQFFQILEAQTVNYLFRYEIDKKLLIKHWLTHEENEVRKSKKQKLLQEQENQRLLKEYKIQKNSEYEEYIKKLITKLSKTTKKEFETWRQHTLEYSINSLGSVNKEFYANLLKKNFEETDSLIGDFIKFSREHNLYDCLDFEEWVEKYQAEDFKKYKRNY